MIKNFTIYGERHSGTNLLESMFTHSSSIPVTWDYGWKHFFGWKNDQIKNYGKNTLFLCIVRNPYDWIMAMHKIRHHIPLDRDSIIDFMTKEWYSVSDVIDTITNKKPLSKRGPYYEAKSNIVYTEIMQDRDWVTNERYKNIFELRAKKLDYLYNVIPTIAKNYEFIRYENLCSEYPEIMIKIFKKYKIKNKNIDIKIVSKKPYLLSKDVKKIINQNIDWDIENKIGYQQEAFNTKQSCVHTAK